MPLHSFKCPSGHVSEVYQPLNGLRETETCHCGEPAQKVFLRFPAAFVQADVHYASPVDGRPITSRQARLEDMARNQCVEYDPGMKDDYLRRQKESDEFLGNKVEEHFDSAIEAMPTRKRELLEQELRSGVDLVTTRA
jgi:hypothetical protein